MFELDNHTYVKFDVFWVIFGNISQTWELSAAAKINANLTPIPADKNLKNPCPSLVESIKHASHLNRIPRRGYQAKINAH